MNTTFADFWQRFSSEPLSKARLLVAVSGGLDSMVLAHWLQAAGISFGIAHANFQLRGSASDADEDFVKAAAEQWGVPFFTQRFDTKTYAEAHGLSTQMAARALRYGWLEDVRAAHGFSHIATAHHLNDQVETLLLHLGRGTGLAGFVGMKPVQGHLLRPLLSVKRVKVAAYAAQHGVVWREDSSNATDVYQRNAVRHHALPALEAIFPDFLEKTAQAMQHAAAALANYQHLLGSQYSSLEKAQVLAFPYPTEVLFQHLYPLGFTPEQIRQMMDTVGQSGLQWQTPDGKRLVSDRTRWLLEDTAPTSSAAPILTIDADDLMVRLPNGGVLFVQQNVAASPFPDGKMAIIVAAEALRFPLTLRHWQTGDVFQPFGMHGQQQKLQDFFTNQKLSLPEKEQTWLLTDAQNRIIWVLGHRLDERFRVRDTTQPMVKISWMPA